MRMLPVVVAVMVGVVALGACGGSAKQPGPVKVVANQPAAQPEPQPEPETADAVMGGDFGGGGYGGAQYGGEMNAYGGLLGNEAGEMNGGFGLGAGSGGFGTKGAVPTVAIGKPTMSSVDLDKAIIRRYIKRNLEKITYCYEKQLVAKDPALAGTVTAEFTIEPDGKVSTSTAAGVDPDVASCIAAVIQAIEFPKPRGGGKINVVYPLKFRPAGG